jgi:hypothetical protein
MSIIFNDSRPLSWELHANPMSFDHNCFRDIILHVSMLLVLHSYAIELASLFVAIHRHSSHLMPLLDLEESVLRVHFSTESIGGICIPASLAGFGLNPVLGICELRTPQSYVIHHSQRFLFQLPWKFLTIRASLPALRI